MQSVREEIGKRDTEKYMRHTYTDEYTETHKYTHTQLHRCTHTISTY